MAERATDDTIAAASAEPSKLELTGSRQYTAWLAEQKLSLAFSTYQAGKLFFVGLQPDGRLSIFERTFNRAMGLWSDTQTLYLSTLYQIWRFDDVLAPWERVEVAEALRQALAPLRAG